jgi:hypothetical protein
MQKRTWRFLEQIILSKKFCLRKSFILDALNESYF